MKKITIKEEWIAGLKNEKPEIQLEVMGAIMAYLINGGNDAIIGKMKKKSKIFFSAVLPAIKKFQDRSEKMGFNARRKGISEGFAEANGEQMVSKCSANAQQMVSKCSAKSKEEQETSSSFPTPLSSTKEIEEHNIEEKEVSLRDTKKKKKSTAELVAIWNEKCPSKKTKLGLLSENRRRQLSALIVDMEKATSLPGDDVFAQVAGMIEESDFASGRSGRWLGCNLGWLLENKEHWRKVYDGNYRNKDSTAGEYNNNQFWDNG